MSSRTLPCPFCQKPLERVDGILPNYCEYCNQSIYNRSALLVSNLKNNKRLQLSIGIGALLLILIVVVVNLLRSN